MGKLVSQLFGHSIFIKFYWKLTFPISIPDKNCPIPIFFQFFIFKKFILIRFISLFEIMPIFYSRSMLAYKVKSIIFLHILNGIVIFCFYNMQFL